MLFKSITASILLLALTSFVNADAAPGCVVTPALGVSGTPGSGDVLKPSSDAPCGNKPIADDIDSSTSVQAATDGTFNVNVVNFEAGATRNIGTVKVDASGEGTNFVGGATIGVNGDQDPTTTGSQQLTVKLPDGIKCAGGKNKNCCVASFVTAAGYGNCVVVCQPQTSQTSAGDSTAANQEKAKTGTTNGNQTGNQKQQGQNTGNNDNGAKNHKRMLRKRRL